MSSLEVTIITLEVRFIDSSLPKNRRGKGKKKTTKNCTVEKSVKNYLK